MKSYVLFLMGAGILLWGCGAKKNLPLATASEVVVVLNLEQVSQDRVPVTLDPGAFTVEQIRFYIPKTVPGTYSTDNYGQFVEQLVALDYKDQPLKVTREDQNTWLIADARSLDRITYFVNDSYDTEGSGENQVFSPAGTNISEGEHFMLNMHGFVGYFEGLGEVPYTITLKTPPSLSPATSLTLTDSEPGSYKFSAGRYFEVIDNPIQVCEDEPESFQVTDITVELSVYSPTGKYSASDFKPTISKMMDAQKAFLGETDGTRRYNILLYLSTMEEDAGGFGALEHHTSTVVVLPESLSKQQLEETMTDVVSHEFFHILTPLNVHSEEIQFFDYNNPKMSRHLWMYEGATEYFANLFQIRQGLIEEEAFYSRISEKIQFSQFYDDRMSFTEMSSNILEEPYESNYANVYQKGALINMTLDILLRDLSGGSYGVLDLMRKLSEKYDRDTPFRDPDLFREIEQLTYPEVGDFFETYVIGTTPIDYASVLEKVGLGLQGREVPCSFLLHGQSPFIDAYPQEGTIFIKPGIELNSTMKELGLHPGDILNTINGTEVNMETIGSIFSDTFSWTRETTVTVVIDREGKEMRLEGKLGTPTVREEGITPLADPTETQLLLREYWLKG